MQEPLRVVFVEHRHADRGTTAQLLRDRNLDFSWQCVASARELGRVAADFNPHIVLCADDMSGHRLLEASRLLCSQTPIIFVLSVCETLSVGESKGPSPPLEIKGQTEKGAWGRSVVDTEPSMNAQDAADLRRGFSAVLESSAEPAVISDADGWITHANTSACLLLAGSWERTLVTVLGATQGQFTPMPHWLPVPHAAGPESDQYSEIGAMVSGSLASEHGPHRLAYFDSWSLLPTLVHMDDLVGCATASKREYRAALALIAVDRHSARIPDEPHASTSDDELLDCTGSDMQTGVARYGSIVRIAPDDFLVVLSDPSRPADAAIAVQRVLDSLAETRLGSRPARPAGAVSVAAFPAGGGASESQSSTPACESSWQRRRIPPLHAPDEQLAEHVRLGAALGDAMQRDALSVQYQAQFDLKTGRGCGVEALARWALSSGEIIPPSVFIPLAERAGMIHSLGAWMLQSACETAYPWCSRDAQRTTLSVNVSALQIDDDFCTVIERTLQKSGFPGKHLELEITESALVANQELTIGYLKQWKELGVRIAMDDFGTRRSSLSCLSMLPVDRLKLDPSLIHGMTMDAKAATRTREIVSLGAELGLDVIAEGVETEDQLHMLTDLGCPRVQGYLLSRPMPAKQAQVALRKTWGNRLSAVSCTSGVAAGKTG
jgi:EAL domain-containing protein (putative c-di-GMP-specific phosphodiesterase class I)/GGDEF domain-containing protein